MVESTKGIFHKYIKGVMKDCFLFDSWFSSNKSEESVMEVGAEFIGMVNNNNKGLCKDTIGELKNDCTGGSYLLLRSKPMVPGGRPPISIVYKYNTRKVPYFTVTDNTGSTQAVLPYLFEYP